MEGRLAFTFYSHLKNIKEVHVSATHQQEGTVRGQVGMNDLHRACVFGPTLLLAEHI